MCREKTNNRHQSSRCCIKSIFARLAEFVTGPSRLGSSLLLLAIVGAVFANALPGEFVWDDQIYLLNKPAYQNFNLHRILLSLANDLEYLQDYCFWSRWDWIHSLNWNLPFALA